MRIVFNAPANDPRVPPELHDKSVVSFTHRAAGASATSFFHHDQAKRVTCLLVTEQPDPELTQIEMVKQAIEELDANESAIEYGKLILDVAYCSDPYFDFSLVLVKETTDGNYEVVAWGADARIAAVRTENSGVTVLPAHSAKGGPIFEEYKKSDGVLRLMLFSASCLPAPLSVIPCVEDWNRQLVFGRNPLDTTKFSEPRDRVLAVVSVCSDEDGIAARTLASGALEPLELPEFRASGEALHTLPAITFFPQAKGLVDLCELPDILAADGKGFSGNLLGDSFVRPCHVRHRAAKDDFQFSIRMMGLSRAALGGDTDTELVAYVLELERGPEIVTALFVPRTSREADEVFRYAVDLTLLLDDGPKAALACLTQQYDTSGIVFYAGACLDAFAWRESEWALIPKEKAIGEFLKLFPG